MKLTVLADNNTIIDRYYLGEPALSFLLEDGEEKILFDTGYSDVFIRNAEALGIDLSDVKTIVLSHGHNDHTGGLRHLMERCDLSGVTVIAHPQVFEPREYDGLAVGSPVSREECIACGMKIQSSAAPVKLSSHLTFLGEIPRVTDFESQEPIGTVLHDGIMSPDYVSDDSAIVYRSEAGLFIITGCSHSGICNILTRAKSLPGNEGLPVIGVIGGFHLMKDDRQLRETVSFLKQNVTGELYPCHCVSLYAKHCLMQAMPVKEIGSGMTLDIQ